MNEAVLGALATGRLELLQAGPAEASHDLLTPFLPGLVRLDLVRRSPSAPGVLRSTLSQYEQVNTMREYAAVLQQLTLEDVDIFAAEQQPLPGTAPLAAHRRFEQGNARERVCVVLSELRQVGSRTNANMLELFTNPIYTEELASILSLALASPTLSVANGTGDAIKSEAAVSKSSCSLRNIVFYCLQIPLGVTLIERLVLNDPSCIEALLDAVVAALLQLPPALVDREKTLPTMFTQAQQTCLALAELSPMYATLARTKLSEPASVWTYAVTFYLLVEVPVLREDAAVFMYQMTKNEASVATVTALWRLAFGTDPAQNPSIGSGLQQAAAATMNAIRQHLLHDLEHVAMNSTRIAVLNVYIGLLVLGNFHPSEQETTHLLRYFDQLAKAESASSRVISLAYVLVILLCYPLAPSLSKIPSQREESVKAILTLSQQCIFSLYNSKAACSLFIVSTVHLYTRSPSLLPFLAAVVDNDRLPITTSLRVEYLHVFGDIVLKPILTENILAREVLTFPSVTAIQAQNQDLLAELTLRSFHGLLCEKSFLRHHYARKLEGWLTKQMGEVALPLHPLMVSIATEWIENYIVAFEYPIAQQPWLQLSIIPLRSATVTKWLSAACLTQSFSVEASEEIKQQWATGVLALTYALQFNQRVRQAMTVAGSKISTMTSLSCPPSGEICLAYDLTSVPLRNMLHQVLAHGAMHEAFEFIAPTLRHLLIDEFPHVIRDLPFPSSQTNNVSSYWFRKRRSISVNPKASVSSDGSSSSWMELNLHLSELKHAPSLILIQDFELLVARVLPFALSNEAAVSAVYSGFCVQVTQLYEQRVQKEHPRPRRLQMLLVHALCFPDVLRSQEEQAHVHHVQRPSSTPYQATSQLVTYEQVLEEPFRLLQDANEHVLSTPSLLRVLLSLVKEFRLAANVHLANRDLAARKQQQQSTTGETPAAAPPSVNFLQHILIQDCLIVHALLKQLHSLDTESGNGDLVRERNALLCGALEDLFVDNSPRLIVAVHMQGYDADLVPLVTADVPSMRLLWDHWMQSGATTGSASTGNGSSTAARSKLLIDFVTDVPEKELATWSFRLRVFFTLCGQYFDPSQSPLVLQAMKLVWNKLRNVLMSVMLSHSTTSSQVNSQSEPLQVHAAFLESVLPVAVTACAQHADLSAELVQFLLKVQKQGGNSNSTSGRRNGDYRSNEAAILTPAKSSGHGLDDVLHLAYTQLLQQL